MVECFDRIHLRLTETVLRPLQALRQQPPPCQATVRLPGRGCEIDLTVTKILLSSPAGDAVSYGWSARGSINSGDLHEWVGSERFPTPDAAYWDAVDVIGVAVRASTTVIPIPQRLPWTVRTDNPRKQTG